MMFPCFPGDGVISREPRPWIIIPPAETFLKIPLVAKSSFASFRVPLPSGAAKKRKRDDAVAEVFENKSKKTVDQSKPIAKVHLPHERRVCSKEHMFF
jgi:hypothetical protein